MYVMHFSLDRAKAIKNCLVIAHDILGLLNTSPVVEETWLEKWLSMTLTTSAHDELIHCLQHCQYPLSLAYTRAMSWTTFLVYLIVLQ